MHFECSSWEIGYGVIDFVIECAKINSLNRGDM